MREERRQEDRQPTPSEYSSSAIETPKSVRTITHYSQKILDGPDVHSRFDERLEAFIKGSVAMAHLATELQQDLRKSKAAELAREKRRKSRRRVYQSGRVLYAEEARDMARKRDEDEVLKAQVASDRATQKELHKQKDLAKRLAVD